MRLSKAAPPILSAAAEGKWRRWRFVILIGPNISNSILVHWRRTLLLLVFCGTFLIFDITFILGSLIKLTYT